MVWLPSCDLLLTSEGAAHFCRFVVVSEWDAFLEDRAVNSRGHDVK